MDGINDLEYKELRLDLVDLTEGVVGSFLFYYDEEVKKIYELPPQKRGAELRKLANRIKEDYKTGRIAVYGLYALLNFKEKEVFRNGGRVWCKTLFKR